MIHIPIENTSKGVPGLTARATSCRPSGSRQDLQIDRLSTIRLGAPASCWHKGGQRPPLIYIRIKGTNKDLGPVRTWQRKNVWLTLSAMPASSRRSQSYNAECQDEGLGLELGTARRRAGKNTRAEHPARYDWERHRKEQRGCWHKGGQRPSFGRPIRASIGGRSPSH